MDAFCLARRSLVLAVMALFLAAAVPSTSHAITRGAAEAKALKELGTTSGKNPVIVFGDSETIPAGAVVTEAGDEKAHTGGKSGLRTIDAPVVIRNGDEPAYLFHEDQGPYRAFEHPSRVVLVGKDSGEVRVSRTLSWIPVVDGEVLPWFATAGSYEKNEFRVFERGVGAIGRSLRRSARAMARQAQANAAQLESRRRTANALAAEKSCALRVSDTLGNFFDYSGVDRSRARLGSLLEQMERLNAGFRSQRYSASSGRTPTAELERMILRSGCKDVLLYLAGSGYQSGAPAVNVGTAPRGGDLRLQDVSATAIEGVMAAHRDVTFKVVIDAPYAGRIAERLRDESNMAVILTAGSAGEASYAYTPNIVAGGQIVRNTINPTQLLEFTNRLVRGMEAFVDSPLEVDYALSQIAGGRVPSMMVWMLARGLQLGTVGAPALPTPPVVILGGRFQTPNGPPFTPPGPPPVIPPGQAKKNVAPVANDSTVPVVEDTPTSVPLPATDADGDALSFAITEDPEDGSLSGSGNARTYTPAEDFTGTDSFTYRVTDPSGASDTAVVTLNVSAIDDDAVITTSPGSLAVVENDPAAVIDDEVDVTDIDTDTISSATVAITGGFAGAQDVLSFVDTSAISGDYDDATGVLTLTGSASVAAYQAALRTVEYRNTSDAPSVAARTITFAAAGGSDTRGITLSEVNDAPANTVPTETLLVEEDTLEVFTPANDNAISVADVDARSGAIQVSLDVDHGTLSLDDTPGVNFTDADGDSATTLTGTVAAINAALDGAGYTPSNNYIGGDTLTIVTDDKGNTGGGDLVDTDTVDITVGPVNDAPVNVIPLAATTFDEDDSTTFSGAEAPSVSDSDAGGDDLKVTLDVDHGKLTLGGTTGLVFTTGDGTADATMVFTGTTTAINTALNGLKYVPDANFTGDDTLTILTDDQGNNGNGEAESDSDPIVLTVFALNDKPTVAVPADAQTLDEDNNKTLSGAAAPQVADVDAGTERVEVTLGVTQGVIDLDLTTDDGILFADGSADNTKSMTFTGTLTAINAALDGLVYKPDLNSIGTDKLTITIDDLGNTGFNGPNTGSGVIDFTVAAVNDSPVNTVPGAQTLDEDTTKALSPSIADVDAEGDDLKVTLSATKGTIDLDGTTGLTFAGSDADNTKSMTFTGTITAINAALSDLVYDPDPNFASTDTLTITTDDQDNNGSGDAPVDTDTVGLTVSPVNDSPVNTVPGAQTLDEDTTETLSPSIADVDADGDPVKVTLSVSDGIIDLDGTTGLTFAENNADNTESMTFTGTITAINAALSDLVYDPDPNFASTDTLTITTDDQDNNGSGDAPVDTDTVGFTVTPVNDAPVVGTGTTPATFTEGGDAVVVDPAVTASDIDSATLTEATVKITTGYAEGTDALSFVDSADDNITGSFAAATGTLTLSGTDTVANYQAALRTVKFSNPSDNPSGSQRTVRFQVNDGSAVSNLSNQPVIFTNVSPVNDAPVVTTTSTDAAHTEDAGATVVDNALTISDADSTTISDATVIIADAESTDVLAFVNTGDITHTFDPSSRTLSLDGDATVAQYQAALRTVTYRTTDDTPASSRTIRFRVSDGGSTNNLSNVASRTVGITAVNDAPVVNTSAGNASYTEAGSAAAIDGALTLADGDSANLTGATVEITAGEQGTDVLSFTNANGISALSNANGVLTLTGTATVAAYQAALRSVQFSSTSGAPGTSRTITFRVNDGAGANNLSDLASKGIAITNVNSAPTLTLNASPATYTEDGAPLAIVPAATITDVDSANMSEAFVSLGQAREVTDVLEFTAPAGSGITGSINPNNGNLTLSGTATIAQYQEAIRSITFRTTSDNPSTTTRTANVGVYDDAGAGMGDLHNFNVARSNDAPTIATSSGSASYTEAGTPAAIDGALTLTDPDSANLTGATVEITAGEQGTDVLSFTNANGISALSNANGVLTLTGTATVAAYQAALRSVQFSSTSGAPGTSRTITFRVNDGAGANNLSDLASKGIAITEINSAPALGASSGDAAHTEDATATVVDDGLTISDVDSTQLTGATVSVAGADSTDVLAFTNASPITGSVDPSTRVLTLSGTGTLAQYQAALRTVTYSTTDDTPATSRTVSFRVNDGSSANNLSNVVSRTVAITATNDAPVNALPAAQSTIEDTAKALSSTNAIAIADPDAGTGTVSVKLTAGNGTLSLNEPTDGTRTGNGTASVTITGALSAINTALGSLVYTPAANSNGTDAIEVVTNDGGNTGTGGAKADTDNLAMTVTAAADDPTFTTALAPADLAYSEGDGKEDVFPTLTLDDVDGGNLASATVRLTVNYVTGEDVLTLVDQTGITDSFDPATGTLSLSGSRPLADYQTALRAVQYENTSDTPDTATRTATFTIKDPTDRTASTERDITVSPTNDAPVVAFSDDAPTYTEQTAAVVLDDGIDVTDVDDTDLSSARVEVLDELAGDKLTFDAGSTGIANTSTDDHILVLAKSGGASKADWQQVLRTVAFENQTDVVGSSRSIRFTVNDGDTDSADADKSLAVTDTPDRPIVTTGDSLDITEGDGPAVIDATIGITDNDDVASAKVSMASPQTGDDLQWTDNDTNDGITLGSDDNSTDVLTLTGSGTTAEYELALEAVKYVHTGDHPSSTKTISFAAADGDGYGDAATVTVNITPVNDPSVITVPGTTLTFTEGDTAKSVASSITVTDPEDDAIWGAEAEVTTGFTAGQDTLTWVDNDELDGIELDDMNTTPSHVVLTGIGTPADFAAALADVKFDNQSQNPADGDRVVTFRTTDTGMPNKTGTTTRTVNVDPVDDPPVAVDDSATVQEDASAASVAVLGNDTDVDAGPKAISSATDPANGTVVLTGGSAGAHTGLTYQPDPNYCNSPDGSPAASPDTFEYTLNGGDDATVSMTVTCVNDAPVADDETFAGNDSAHGNTTMVVNDGDDGPMVPQKSNNPDPTQPRTVVTGDILQGDTDIDGPGPLTVTAGTFATVNGTTNVADGGAVTVQPDGDFVFYPSATQSCTQDAAYFDYTVEDNASPTKGTDTGRVTINLEGCVWYVDRTSTNSLGTASAPFASIQQAEDKTVSNATIFAMDDSTSATDYSVGHAFQANERLVSEQTGLVVDQDHGTGNNNYTPDTLADPVANARPVIQAENEDVIDLDDNNELRGFVLDPAGTGSSGIAGASGDTGGATIDDVQITDTGSAGTAPALELDSTTGTFNVSNLAITNQAATSPPNTSSGVRLNNAGTVNFNPTGAITITRVGAPALVATATNLGTSTFDDIAVTGSTAGGVNLTNLVGTTALALGDGTGTDLDLATTGSTALAALNVPNLSVASAGTDNISAVSGPAVDVAFTTAPAPANQPVLELDDVDSTNSTSDGINIDNIGAAGFSAATGDIKGATGISFDVHGGNGTITYPGGIGDVGAGANDGNGNAAQITGREGGIVTLSGSIEDDNDADGGVSLSGNTGGSTILSGATKQFNTTTTDAVSFASSDGHTLELTNGSLDIDATTGRGINASSSGTIRVSGSNNTVNTVSGRAVSVVSTDLSSNGFTFQSVGVSGAAGQADNGIHLDTTGTAGGMTITGTGANHSGGTINNTTGAGISLANTDKFNADEMNLTGTNESGVLGRGVTDFTFTDSTIADAGDAKTNAEHAALAFNYPQDAAAPGTQNNLDGVVTVTGNTLTNHYGAGLHVHNYSGTISQATVNGNTISAGIGTFNGRDDAIALDLFGTSGTAANLTQGTLSNNTITGHEGSGIKVQGSQVSGSGSPAGSIGTPGSATNKLVIDSNIVNGDPGSDPALDTGTDAAIGATMTGKGAMNVEITNNGSVADALSGFDGNAIFHGVDGEANGQFVINNNRILVSPRADNQGIFGGSASWITDTGTVRTPTFRTSITNNHVRSTAAIGMGAAIRVLVGGGPSNSEGTSHVKVTNNDVVGGDSFEAISVENGANNTVANSHNLCTQIAQNQGSPGAGAAVTIELRNRGLSPNQGTTNIVGFGGGTGTAAATYLNGQNPAMTPGTSAIAGVFPSAYTFGSCAAF